MQHIIVCNIYEKDFISLVSGPRWGIFLLRDLSSFIYIILYFQI